MKNKNIISTDNKKLIIIGFIEAETHFHKNINVPSINLFLRKFDNHFSQDFSHFLIGKYDTQREGLSII